MATFSYKAKTVTGQTVTGVLTAESQQAAMRMLDERSLFPIQVNEGSHATKAITGRKKKVGLKVLTTFFSQLSDLLRAGVPVLRSLDVLSRQTSNPLLAEILKEIHGDVSGGETLADSMAKHPNAFNHLAIAMVRAGEEGGFLEDVLTRIATFTERQDELRNKLVGSMIYPCILLLAGLSVVTALMIFVVPRIRPLLDSVEDKPWLTNALFWISDTMASQWKWILAGLLVLVMVVVPIIKSDKGKRTLDLWQLRAPVLGRIATMVAICRFCRILGTMLHNGVPVLAALKISKDSAGNQLLAEQIEDAAEHVQRGESLAARLEQGGLFPVDICDMISVAEESNSLETVLVQIADSNEARTGRQIDLGVRLLEPIMLLAMALFVAVIAVALLVPILRMATSMS